MGTSRRLPLFVRSRRSTPRLRSTRSHVSPRTSPYRLPVSRAPGPLPQPDPGDGRERAPLLVGEPEQATKAGELAVDRAGGQGGGLALRVLPALRGDAQAPPAGG